MTAVFIGGTGRSGTNITRQILARSPDVASPNFETRYTVDPNGIMPLLRSLEVQASPFVVDELLRNHFGFLRKLARKSRIKAVLNKLIRMIPGNRKELLVTGFSYADWNLEAHFPGYENRLEEYINNSVNCRYHATRPGYAPLSIKPEMIYLGRLDIEGLYKGANKFISGNIDSAIRLNRAGFYIEDNTYNLIYASTIAKVVPGAKFIHVRRDPFDTVASYCGQRWCPSSPQLAAKLIADLLTTIADELSAVSSAQVFTLTLEGLVENSKEQIQRMCDFLDLEFNDGMGELNLSNSNIGCSSKEFTESELDSVKSILGGHVEKFNDLRHRGI